MKATGFPKDERYGLCHVLGVLTMPGKLQLGSPVLGPFESGTPSLKEAPKLHILVPRLWGTSEQQNRRFWAGDPSSESQVSGSTPLSGLPDVTTLLGRCAPA